MTLRTLIFAFAVAMASAPAAAEDFTFVVPVEVTNLPPEINRMTVSCSASIAPGTPGLPPRMIGSSATQVTISGGAYRGDVTVAFNASLSDAGYANEYSCGITSFGNISPSGSGIAYHTSDYDDPGRFFPLDPSAPFRVRASGRLGE